MNQRIKAAAFGAVLLLILALAAYAAPSSISVYFTDNIRGNTVPSVTPMEQALLSLLASATTSIDGAFYDFNRDSVRDALIAAHQRGVQVRVVTDDEARFFIDSYIPYYQALETAGIPVKDDERVGSIMHDKYFIVDGGTVWTGSTNMSDNGFTANHNNSVAIESTDLAAVYQNDFDQMWTGKFSKGKDPSPVTSLVVDGVQVEAYFSPEDQALSHVIAQVNAAQASIEFAIFFLTDDGLRDALIATHKRGVVVRGQWDNLGAASPFSDDEALCEAGIPIKIEDTPGKMHHKFMVIDAAGAGPRVVTGSMNLTGSGDNSNDENTLILHDATTAQAYSSAFAEMWDALDASTQCRTGGTGTFVYLPLVLRMEATSPSAQLRLGQIHYDGDVPTVESDEWVEVVNDGSQGDVAGWQVRDDDGNIFTFPSFVMGTGQSCRVYTNEIHPETCGFSFSSEGAIWANGGDLVELVTPAGAVVDSACWGNGCP